MRWMPAGYQTPEIAIVMLREEKEHQMDGQRPSHDLETLNNSEHFAIMYVVVAFGRDPFARPKGDGMKTCIWVPLTKNAGKSEARIINEKSRLQVDWG